MLNQLTPVDSDIASLTRRSTNEIDFRRRLYLATKHGRWSTHLARQALGGSEGRANTEHSGLKPDSTETES